MTRLPGGSKKGVYRLACPDGFSAVLYVWSAAEDYWPAADGSGSSDEDAGVFGHASGLGLFSAASRRLAEAGVRVPRVYLEDGSRCLYPADIALVEDVRG
ncbi:MAG TPA: aminoglycoside phosphotransferase family protein, partial [Trebonia sp.]|nr:aminoglycoside phosphotransferase family protein [Trebonia sp.]